MVRSEDATVGGRPDPAEESRDGQRADELLPALREALAADTVTVIACPVDYSANLELIRSLGELDESLS